MNEITFIRASNTETKTIISMSERVNVEVQGAVGEDQSAGAVSKGANKKSGKASRQKKTDAFRSKVGTKQLNEARERVQKRLRVFDESTAELEQALNSMAISVQPTAVPLPVATRGVGFAAVVEYLKMCTTWSLQAIAEICTIHHYYRVSLSLAYFKLFEAQYGKSEFVLLCGRSIHLDRRTLPGIATSDTGSYHPV